jgi:hypothetical protein
MLLLLLWLLLWLLLPPLQEGEQRHPHQHGGGIG